MRCKYCGFPTVKKKHSTSYRKTCDRVECFQLRNDISYKKVRAKRIIANKRKKRETS